MLFSSIKKKTLLSENPVNYSLDLLIDFKTILNFKENFKFGFYIFLYTLAVGGIDGWWKQCANVLGMHKKFIYIEKLTFLLICIRFRIFEIKLKFKFKKDV